MHFVKYITSAMSLPSSIIGPVIALYMSFLGPLLTIVNVNGSVHILLNVIDSFVTLTSSEKLFEKKLLKLSNLSRLVAMSYASLSAGIAAVKFSNLASWLLKLLKYL